MTATLEKSTPYLFVHMADEKTIQMIPFTAPNDQPNALNSPMTLKKLC